MQNREYFNDALADYVRVTQNEKRAVIVSSGKSTLAYEAVATLAETRGDAYACAMWLCEDGELHEHVIVAEDDYTVNLIVDTVERSKNGLITRPELQLYLGRFLGYTDEEIVNFIASATARECPCDCCGGPFVSEEITG
jgi:hypothetical protein